MAQAGSSNIKVQGIRLRAFRHELGMSQRALGEAMGVSEKRVQQIERSESSGIYAASLRKLAGAIGQSMASVQGKIASRLVSDMMVPGMPIGESGQIIPEFGKEAATLDENVQPYSEVKIPEIPLFDLPLAAGKWTEVTVMGEVCNPHQIDHGLFRVRLRGDSMKPKYQDGDVVEFRCLLKERNGIELGKDYYVQRDDGAATFKTVIELTDEQIVLAAKNTRKYKDKLRVLRTSVVKMAKAIAIVQLVE